MEMDVQVTDLDTPPPRAPLRKVIADGLPRAEQEIVCSRCGDEDTWTMTTSHPPTARKLERIAASYGVQGQLLNKYTIRFRLPLSAVSFRRSRGFGALSGEESPEEEDGEPADAEQEKSL